MSSRAQIEVAARILREAMRDKRYKDTTLGPWALAFLAYKETEEGMRPATLDSYERELSRLCLHCAGLHPADVQTADIRQVIATYPPKTRRKVTAIYRSFFGWLYDEEHIDRDPAARIKSPKQTREVVYDIFSEDERARLITLGPDRFHPAVAIRDRVAILLLLETGIRSGELRKLRVEDVDLDERWVVIRDGKGGKGRVVPFARPPENQDDPEAIRRSLALALIELMATPLPRIDRPLERGELLFWRYGRRPLAYGEHPDQEFTRVITVNASVSSRVQDWWKAVVARAGIRYRRMHMCRHTYATRMLKTGSPLTTIQKALGHSRIETTTIYTHTMIEDVAAAVEAMSRAEAPRLDEALARQARAAHRVDRNLSARGTDE